MSLYKYKAIKEGQEYEETKEFDNKQELYIYIRKNGGAVVSVEEITGKKISLGFSFLKRVKAQEVISFAKNLAVMLDAGLSVSRAISIMQKQSKNKKFVAILQDLYDSINKGDTLSKAMENHKDIFSDIFISMVRAGEESGKLSFSLRVVAVQLEKASQLTKKIKGAMIYPSIIITLMLVMGIILMVYMVPTLTETFKGLNVQLPLPTRIVIAISDFLRGHIFLNLGVLAVLILGLTSFIKTKRGRNMGDFIYLKLPIIGTMTREVNAARTARTLASLISSGVDIVSALDITAGVLRNHYFKVVLQGATKRVQTGELISECLSKPSNLYPIFVSEMLAVGEETGKVTDMLNNIADFYEAEIDQKTKDLSTIIEPVLMIFIGIAVGLFAIAMLLPTYSLVDAIQ